MSDNVENTENVDSSNERESYNHNSSEVEVILDKVPFDALLVNPVVNYSMRIMLLAKKISEGGEFLENEVEKFKKDFVNEVLSISSKLSTLSKYDEQDITRFRYCLCVFIDEMVMKNHSFIGNMYAQNSLSIRFFKEPSGGNKFFGIMDKWLENPAKNSDMLEFIYLCLVQGYQGKFSVDDEGEKKLYLLMENIASAIAPAYNTDEMKAFDMAYTEGIKENFWSKYSYTLKKTTFVIIPIVIILIFYFSSYFLVYKSNLETSTFLSNKINSNIEEEKNK